MKQTEGNFDGQPQKRAYIIELPGIEARAKVRVNGKRTKTVYDRKLNGLKIPIKKTGIDKAITIQIL